jgi:hypothetical protein
MQNKHFVLISLIILPFVALTSLALIGSNKLKPEAALAETVRESTAQYQRTLAAGHDLLHPEAIIYAPNLNGSIQLGAVEYMVPAAMWDAENTNPPQVLGQSFHLHERLRMYVLHSWIWKDNPSGIFEDWNPDVSFPMPLKWDGPMRWR